MVFVVPKKDGGTRCILYLKFCSMSSSRKWDLDGDTDQYLCSDKVGSLGCLSQLNWCLPARADKRGLSPRPVFQVRGPHTLSEFFMRSDQGTWLFTGTGLAACNGIQAHLYYYDCCCNGASFRGACHLFSTHRALSYTSTNPTSLCRTFVFIGMEICLMSMRIRPPHRTIGPSARIVDNQSPGVVLLRKKPLAFSDVLKRVQRWCISMPTTTPIDSFFSTFMVVQWDVLIGGSIRLSFMEESQSLKTDGMPVFQHSCSGTSNHTEASLHINVL